MQEQVTKKSILNYIEEIRKLELNKPDLIAIRERICDKLDVLLIPLAKSMERIEENQKKIREHWEQYGDNYNSIPTLHSAVPNYVESFGDFVALAFEEKSILTKEIIKLFSISDTQKMEIFPEPDEEEEKKEETEISKEKPKRKYTKKKKEKKQPEFTEEDLEEIEPEIELEGNKEIEYCECSHPKTSHPKNKCNQCMCSKYRQLEKEDE